jgi:hypothetical protein
MSATLRTHIRSSIIGYVALFFALSTGSAVALSGSNTVFSDDIVDNEVKSADVRNDNLTGGGLAATDLKPSSVGTSEVAANSLNGADINESGLGIVPNANQLDGIDSTGFLSSGSVKELIFQDVSGVPPTALATVGPYTIKGACGDLMGATGLHLIANGPDGTSDYLYTEATGDSSFTHRSGQLSISASTDNDIISPLVAVGPTEVKRAAGTAMLKTGSDVVQVDFNAVAGPGSCRIYGTATKGT